MSGGKLSDFSHKKITLERLAKAIPVRADVCELRALGSDAVKNSENDLLLKENGCISMLEVLYDVAASISMTRDLNEVLLRFLHTLTEIIGARAGVVRLLGDGGEMRLVASVGMDDELVERERIVPERSCVCGNVGGSDHAVFQPQLKSCSIVAGREFFENDSDSSMIVVPLRHQGKELGVYNLYVDAHNLDNYRKYEELFTCIGRYLGMAIEKAQLDEEATHLSVMEERTRLANELHDSLAQTIASVRF